MSNSSTTIIGNLTREPEVRFVPSGKAVATIGVAVNRSWKNKNDEWEQETSFFDVKAWGDLAEQVQILEKGVKVIVTGDLKQESWTTEDNQTRSKVVLTARDIAVSVTAIDGFNRRQRQEGGSSKPAPKSATQSFDDAYDEPF